MDSLVSTNNLIRAVLQVNADAARTAPGLRSCALARCGAREEHPSHFKCCVACRVPAYCGKECQTEDWPNHKAACKAARKAKEQASSDGAGPSAAAA
jgi:hypothetical protein